MFVSILFSVIIATVNAQITNCRNYTECANDTISPTNNGIFCFGSLSCNSANAMLTGDFIGCYGSRACANIPSIQYTAGTGDAYCSTLETCVDSVFTMENVYCDGSKACIGTTITAAAYVRGYGAYSLVNASIVSVNKSVNISLGGHYTGYGSTIQCNGTSRCEIICGGTACANLNIKGSGIWNVSYLSKDTIRTNMIMTNDGTTHKLLDAIKNNEECTQTFDIYREQYQGSNIMSDGTGSVCCRGHESCREIGMISLGNQTLLCSGYYSCFNIRKIEGEHANIVCSGKRGCYASNIVTKADIICSAMWGCQFSNITSSANIYLSGYQSGYMSNIYISPNSVSSIFLSGYQSGYHVSIYCLLGAVCSIYCQGTAACFNVATMDCSKAHCNVYCSIDSDCPLNYTMNPTQAPTYNPTNNSYTTTIQSSLSFQTTSQNTSVMQQTDKQTDTQNNSKFTWIIITVFGIILVCILMSIYIYMRNMRKMKSDGNMRNDVLELDKNREIHNVITANSVENIKWTEDNIITADKTDFVKVTRNDDDIVNVINILGVNTPQNDDDILDHVNNTKTVRDEDTPKYNETAELIENINYKTWTVQQTYEWIMNVENGVFRIYSNELLKNLRIEKVNGECMDSLDKNDLHRLGIVEFKHKTILLQYIKELKSEEGA